MWQYLDPERSIIKNAPYGIFRSTLSGRPLSVNRALCHLLGYENESELLALQLQTDLYCDPADRERVLQRLQPGAEPREFETTWKRKDGRVILVRVHAQATHDESGQEIIEGFAEDITTQKYEETARIESEQRYRKLFSQNPHPMWVYDVETLAFLEVNDAAVAQYGYSREEFLRMTLKDIRPEEDIPGLIADVESGRVGYGAPEVFRHRRKNGTLLFVKISSYRFIQDGRWVSLILADDVTETVVAQRSLRESEERFRLVVESCPIGIYIHADGILQYLNPSALDIFGAKSAEDVIGHSFLERVHPDSLPQVVERARAVTTTHQGVPFQEQRYKRLDGDPVSVEVMATPFIYRGENGAIVFLRDLTQQKVNEEKQRGMEVQLRHAQKMEAIGRLAGGVAHDFNNILMVIQSYAEILQDGLPVGGEQRRRVLEIMKASEHAAHLTAQLLAFSRRQTGKPVAINLNAIVRETAKMLQRIIGEDIELELRLTQIPMVIHADPDQIVQVLMNLGVNARDAMPTGGNLTITTESRVVSGAEPGEKYLPDGEYVRVVVADTGTGMTEEIRSKVFDPFFTTKEVGKGTGLGLATVYGIVKGAGGYLWVESELGRGACFSINFPRMQDECETKSMIPATEQLIGSEVLLIVDDAAALREAMAEYLSALGYTVLTAASGPEAISIAHEHPEVNVLVTDLVMPKMSGRELARFMASSKPSVKIVFISGYPGDAMSDIEANSPNTAFLPKPFSLGTMAREIRRLLDVKQN